MTKLETKKKDEIDITPPDIDPVNGTGALGIKSTVFQEMEWFHILQNPGNLTKEGILQKLANWRDSHNAHANLKYNAMLLKCQRVMPSRKDSKGRIVLAIDWHGKPKWVWSNERSEVLPPNPEWERIEKELTKKELTKGD